MPPQIATNKPGQVRPISIYKPAREGLSRWVIEWAAHFEGRLPAWGAVGGGGAKGGHVRGGLGRMGTLCQFQTLSLLMAVAGCQKELAVFPAPKGRTEETLDLLVSFFQGAGKQGSQGRRWEQKKQKGKDMRMGTNICREATEYAPGRLVFYLISFPLLGVRCPFYREKK